MPRDYLRKEEAEDLVEDVLRRCSEQPDSSRRETVTNGSLPRYEVPALVGDISRGTFGSACHKLS